MNRFAIGASRITQRGLGEPFQLIVDGVPVDHVGIHAPEGEVLDREAGEMIVRSERLICPLSEFTAIPAVNAVILHSGRTLYVARAVPNGPALEIELSRTKVR